MRKPLLSESEKVFAYKMQPPRECIKTGRQFSNSKLIISQRKENKFREPKSNGEKKARNDIGAEDKVE